MRTRAPCGAPALLSILSVLSIISLGACSVAPLSFYDGGTARNDAAVRDAGFADRGLVDPEPEMDAGSLADAAGEDGHRDAEADDAADGDAASIDAAPDDAATADAAGADGALLDAAA